MRKYTNRLGIPMLGGTMMLLLSVGMAHAALMDNLVFHATFDSDFNNQAGNLHTAAITSDPTIDANSKFGAGSVHMDRNDALVFDDSGTGGDLHLRDQDFTISLWFNTDSQAVTTRNRLFQHDTGQVQWYFQVNSVGQRFITTYTSTGNPNSSVNVTGLLAASGVWNHLALTMDRNAGAHDGVTTVWVNGAAIATYNAEQSETIFGGSSITMGDIGGIANPARYDEYGIWHRALSTEEIGTLATSPIPEPMTLGLIGTACIGLFGYRRLVG